MKVKNYAAQAGSLIYVVCIFVCIVSVILVGYLRREHQMQVRQPGLSIIISVCDILLIICLYFQESNELGCELILWCGNILTDIALMVGLMRVWSIRVLSDRDMRKTFRWTTTSFFLLKVAFAVLIFAIILTFLLAKYDSYYNRMVEENTCFFLLPFWDFLPNLALYLAFRIFLASKVKKTSHLEKTEYDDYYGICRELKMLNFVLFVMIFAYFGYTYYFLALTQRVEISQAYHAARYILLAAYFSSALFTTTVPAIKCLSAKFSLQLKKVRHQQYCWKQITVTTSLPRSHLNEVQKIWDDEQLTKQFRQHAQKFLCAESVDFCVEVNAYKTPGEQCEGHSSQEKMILLHQQFMKINEEFIMQNAPSEINISHAQKIGLLQFVQLESFCALDYSSALSIFDEAKVEMERVLKENLWSSFSRDFAD